MQSGCSVLSFRNKSLADSYEYANTNPVIYKLTWDSLVRRIHVLLEENKDVADETVKYQLATLQQLILKPPVSAKSDLRQNDESAKIYYLNKSEINFFNSLLPPELRIYILSFLPFQELTRLQAVSKTFSNDIIHTPITSKFIHLEVADIVVRTVATLSDITKAEQSCSYANVLEAIRCQPEAFKASVSQQVRYEIEANAPNCFDTLSRGWDDRPWTEWVVMIAGMMMLFGFILSCIFSFVVAVSLIPLKLESKDYILGFGIAAIVSFSVASVGLGITGAAKIHRDNRYADRLNRSTQALTGLFFHPKRQAEANLAPADEGEESTRLLREVVIK